MGKPTERNQQSDSFNSHSALWMDGVCFETGMAFDHLNVSILSMVGNVLLGQGGGSTVSIPL